MSVRTAVVDAEGVVTNIIMAENGAEPPQGSVYLASDTAGIGDTYDGDAFVRPLPPAPEPTPDLLAEFAKVCRQRLEARGITIAGFAIATDDRSQGKVSGALLRVMRGAESIRWKTETGFVDLSAAQIEAIADAVGSHVQDAFDREADAVAGINGGVIETFAQVEAVFA